MSDMEEYVYQHARSLPVVLLLDTSGSMNEGNHIGIMNDAVKTMLQDFKKSSNTVACISVAIYAFGGTPSRAREILPLTAMDELEIDALEPMVAGGMTPMGEAFDLAKSLIEDKSQIPAHSYRPTVVLVSDGMPNDNWEEPLRRFKEEGRSAKCYRMAMGIGVAHGTEEYDVLRSFVSDAEQVFDACDAAGISRFFNLVTMSTTSRVSSSNPNVVEPIEQFASAGTTEPEDDDDFPF